MAEAKVNVKGSVRAALQDFYDHEKRNSDKIERHRLGLGEDDPLPPYRHQEYPKHLHRADGEFLEVANEKEEKRALKLGYVLERTEPDEAQSADAPAAEPVPAA